MVSAYKEVSKTGGRNMVKTLMMRVLPVEGFDFCAFCVERAKTGWCLLQSISKGGWITATFVLVET